MDQHRSRERGPEEVAVESVLGYFDVWGVQAVVLKADQEPAIQALLAEVRRRRGTAYRTMIEKPPRYSSQSNGLAEGAVRRVEQLSRILAAVIDAK